MAILNSWKAILHAGEQAGLEDEALIKYVQVTTEVFNDKTEDGAPFDAFDDSYIEFLNNEILTDDRVTSIFVSKGISPVRIEDVHVDPSTGHLKLEIGSRTTNQTEDDSSQSQGTDSTSKSGSGSRSDEPVRRESPTEVRFIVKAAVKEALGDFEIPTDFFIELDRMVETLVINAARRAESNDRKTVQPRDL